LGLRGNFEECVKTAIELGYGGIELFVEDPTRLTFQEIKKLIKSYGLEVPAVGTGPTYVQFGLSFTSSNAEIRGKAVKRIRQYIELAEKVESNIIIGSVKGKYETDYKDGWLCLKDCLEKCLEVAARLGVHMLLEPLNRYESNIINTLGEALRLIEELGSEWIRVMGDTFHMNIEERSIYGAIKDTREYLQYIHFADSNRLAPGQGHLDFKEIINSLKEINYKNFLSVEILPIPDQHRAAKLAIEHLGTLI
jgi:sugar phosphate isomerase/epimerase